MYSLPSRLLFSICATLRCKEAIGFPAQLCPSAEVGVMTCPADVDTSDVTAASSANTKCVENEKGPKCPTESKEGDTHPHPRT